MGAGKSKQQTDPKQLGLTTNYYQGYPNMPDYRGSPQNFQMQLAQPGAFPQTPIDQIYQPPNILDNNVQQDGFNYQHFIPEPHLQQQQPQIANNFHNSHPKFHSEHTPTNYNHLAASSTHYPNTFSPREFRPLIPGFAPAPPKNRNKKTLEENEMMFDGNRDYYQASSQPFLNQSWSRKH